MFKVDFVHVIALLRNSVIILSDTAWMLSTPVALRAKKVEFVDEYRRWKRERDELRAKLDETRSKQAPAVTDVDPQIFVDLREIYINTLGTVKGIIRRCGL